MRPFRPAHLRQVGRLRRLNDHSFLQSTASRRGFTLLGGPSGSHGSSPAQTVHVRRPYFSSRRMTLFAVHGIIFYSVAKWLLKEEEEVEPVMDDEEAEEPLFIACQYPQRLPLTNYKGDDPEWQEFVRLNRDQERMDSIQYELANKVMRIVQASPAGQKLGPDVQVRKWWLDPFFPDRRPPEYTRKGLEITEDAIYWKDDVIPYAHFKQLEKMLIPKSVYRAVSDGVHLLYRLQLLKIKSLFNVPYTDVDRRVEKLATMAYTSTERYAAATQELKQLEGQINDFKNVYNANKSEMDEATREEHEQWYRDTEDKVKRIRIQTRRLQALMDARAIFMPKEAATEDAGAGAPQSARSGALGNILNHIPTRVSFEVPMDIVLSKFAMMTSLRQNWQTGDVSNIPVGSMALKGDVELISSTAICRVMVEAFYNPGEARWKQIAISIRLLRETSQAPKG